jgi:hypothetical protein
MMPKDATLLVNDFRLSLREIREAELYAAELVRDEPALVSSLDFGPCVAQGEGLGPRILIGDQSEIPLLALPTPPVLDHRMALLAKDGDTVVVRARDADFFHYIKTTLNRSDVTYLAAGADPRGPVMRMCREDPKLRVPLEALVRQYGGATLQPYMATGNAWRLAQALGESTGQRVHVSGPGPRIWRRANDKLWFTTLARHVLGVKAVPPTMRAYGPSAAAGLVRKLARQSEHIVIKVPDSAGSAGNIRLESARFAEVPLALIHRFLRRQLAAIGWRGRYPLLVGVWDSDVTCSPSIQMWLPHIKEGSPRVDGVFEQRVRGVNAAFVGGQRSTLPEAVQMRLAHEALRIAAVLQGVGYYGRCSFDAVMVRDGAGDLHPHWIECNGRWGGVSIPMTAATFLAGGDPPEGMVILQTSSAKQRLTTAELLASLEPLLFETGKSTEGIVIIAPTNALPDTQLALMAIAPQQRRAEDLMETALIRLDI